MYTLRKRKSDSIYTKNIGGSVDKFKKMADKVNKIKVDKVERPELAKHDSKLLDLAFAMDCTGSMGSYIDSARNNIRQIVEEIVASEKSEVRLALVEYRDHPPQDSSFVTRVHDFTESAKTMKDWLGQCSASGGGDTPEAVADALQDVLKLSWRENATKICVCISDAPPHGLGCGSDGFPNGCPAGNDPMDITNKLAEKGVTIYMVGCEPSITPYKDFFMAVAFKTGGQYVPLTKAKLLSKVIIGGAQEEMCLEQLMAEVNANVDAEIAAGRDINEEAFSHMVHQKFSSKGVQTKQLRRNNAELETANSSPMAKEYAGMSRLSDVRKKFKPVSMPMQPSMRSSGLRRSRGGPPAMAMMGGGPPPPPGMAMGDMDLLGAAPPAPGMSSFGMGAGMEESYDCVEEGISYAQSSRVVQKALARKKVAKK